MIGKSIFVWNIGAIYNGDVVRIARTLADAGFQSAMLHHQNLSQWRTPERIALISELRKVGVEPIASAAVYYGTETEGEQAASICNEYELSAIVLDAESTYDNNDPTGSKTPQMLRAFRNATGAQVGWCSWARHLSPTTGAQWHPIAILKAAMTLCDFGVPMMYWSGETSSAAITLAQQSFEQWRDVTDKPIVPAGRAYVGDGGTAKAVAMEDFEFYVHYLSAGVTWWSMEHAIALGVWNTLAELPSFGGTQPPEDDEGANMIEGISLTDASVALDLKAAAQAGKQFVYFRGHKVTKDDQKVTVHREAAKAAGLPYGAFIDFDYRYNGANAVTPGLAQATELANKALPDDPLPPGIRLWDIENVAKPPMYDYARLLSEVLYYASIKVRRPVVLMANLSTITSILGQLSKLSDDQRNFILGVQWVPITWSSATVPVLPSPLTKFPVWEYTNREQAVPGASGVALMRWPGTREQLVTWGKNTTLDNVPAWGAPPADNDPPPPPPPPSGEVTLASLAAQLDRIEAAVARLAERFDGVFK